MKLTIIGAGYVGLVTAAVFSDLGNEVSCVEISNTKVENLKKGIIPFFEPGLEEIIKRNYEEKRLTFSTDYKSSLKDTEVVFICVGTPPKSTGEADLTHLFSAVEETAKNIEKDTLIVIKSTFPIGFENDLESIVKKNSKHNFEFAACPEFLREGTAINDYQNPDRVVIGADNKKAINTLLDLHSPLPGKRIICDMRSAQLIKYSANAFLATKISFANALSVICEKTGADVEKVLEGLGADARIGSSFLKPGVGYGGSCLPKDVQAFIAQASSFDYNFDLLKSVDSINQQQQERFITKIRTALKAGEQEKANLAGNKLAILGLAFKPNTDDMRDAPSVRIIQKLLDLGAEITAYDPEAMDTARKIFPAIDYAGNSYDAVLQKDALIILTDWDEFKQLDLEKIKGLLKTPVIIDGRNIFDPEKAAEIGFKYYSVGR